METLALWLLVACVGYSILFAVVYNSITFYEEGGRIKLDDSVLTRIDLLKQQVKSVFTNFLKLRNVLLK